MINLIRKWLGKTYEPTIRELVADLLHSDLDDRYRIDDAINSLDRIAKALETMANRN